MIDFNSVDLHLHTTASDGSDSPAELIGKATDMGLGIISVTDHDTLAGLQIALALTNGGIRIIPGIEFSCHAYDDDGFDCHILGYGFDPQNREMTAAIQHGRQMRFTKLESRIDYLADNFGIYLTDEEIKELRGYNAVAKPHLARVLIRRGLASSVADAIDKYLKGAKFPDDRIDAKEAIDAIHAAGGIAVYAHPLGGERERRLTPCELKERVNALSMLGIDGLEAYYSRYDEKDRALIMSLAHENGLLVSGGSDYHGENKTVRLGELSKDNVKVSFADITVLERLI